MLYPLSYEGGGWCLCRSEGTSDLRRCPCRGRADLGGARRSMSLGGGRHVSMPSLCACEVRNATTFEENPVVADAVQENAALGITQ